MMFLVSTLGDLANRPPASAHVAELSYVVDRVDTIQLMCSTMTKKLSKVLVHYLADCCGIPPRTNEYIYI